jgi:hypothetical protein
MTADRHIVTINLYLSPICKSTLETAHGTNKTQEILIQLYYLEQHNLQV